MHPDWVSFRRKRRVYLLCWWAYHVVIIVGHVGWATVMANFPARPPRVIALLGLSCWLAIIFSFLVLPRFDPVIDFRCPRCGKAFYIPSKFSWLISILAGSMRELLLWYSFFQQRCQHCGLPEWADPKASEFAQGDNWSDTRQYSGR
jgi:heme A synthase